MTQSMCCYYMNGRPWRRGCRTSPGLVLCVSSVRRGHANLLYIVPILMDDPQVWFRYVAFGVFMMLLCYCVIVLLCSCVIVCLCYRAIVLLCVCVIVFMCSCVLVFLCYCVLVLLCYYVIV